MVLDGEIAVPDDRGVTHIDALNEAISARQPDRFAYFAFDLLHLDGHDLRRCPLEDRKTLLRDVIGAARSGASSASTISSGSAASCSKRCARWAPRVSCRSAPAAPTAAAQPGIGRRRSVTRSAGLW